VDWIHLDRGSDQWKAVMNMIMNLLASIKCFELLDYASVG
jgi:hypothetical protein